MALDNIYNDEHWEELIEIIIQRIGIEKFISIVNEHLHYTKRIELITMPDAIKRSEKWKGIE
jgi:hypothetical protein